MHARIRLEHVNPAPISVEAAALGILRSLCLPKSATSLAVFPLDVQADNFRRLAGEMPIDVMSGQSGLLPEIKEYDVFVMVHENRMPDIFPRVCVGMLAPCGVRVDVIETYSAAFSSEIARETGEPFLGPIAGEAWTP